MNFVRSNFLQNPYFSQKTIMYFENNEIGKSDIKASIFISSTLLGTQDSERKVNQNFTGAQRGAPMINTVSLSFKLNKAEF